MPGLFHRGAALFEDFGTDADGQPNGATPDDCDGYDADLDDINEVPAYCIAVRWHEIERADAIAAGDIFDESEIVRAVAWVSRPVGSLSDARDFDTYRPGADLVLAPASVDANGDLSLGAEASVLAGCGLDPSTADIRGLALSWDATRISFGARSSASAPLRLFEMSSDGSGCAAIAGVAAATDLQNGILTHDFDPAYSTDGRLVFASTRGNLDRDILDHDGPSRTPAAMQPNANLYVFEDGGIRQLTYLLNQEVQPAFMTDGRLIMTTEKREPDFHQLAGRRQNLDGGDYHPLFAQRGSVGYASATEIVELLDRNFALVAAPLEAVEGAGRIAIVNRSIGPDQDDRDPGDRFYIGSQRIITPVGAFRSPVALPTGRILVSCDQSAPDLTSGNFNFDLCELRVETGALRPVGGVAGRANIEAVAVFAREPRHLFVSRIDEANGHTYVEPGAIDAEVNVVDFPVLATLLFSNTRIGRPINFDIGGVDVHAEYPPPASATTFADVSGEVISDAFGQMYLRRVHVGNAPLNADGSVRIRYRGGLPIVLGATDASGTPLQFGEGAPFTGEIVQREQMQFYPGERANQSLPRGLFNALCGGCHGSITGRELDVAVDIDILTRASRSISNGQEATSLGL